MLTAAGKTLYRRALVLVEEAQQMENLAAQFSAGWEPDIRIAMDALFPEWLMLDTIAEFTEQSPLTRIECIETVLSGTDEALLRKEADIVIGSRIPPGFMGDPILDITFIAVAHPDHPLHQIDRTLDLKDLRLHRQLVIRDSGSRDIDSGWLGAQQRLTLSNFTTSIAAACRGLGYAWYPSIKIEKELKSGLLKPLPLASGAKKSVQLSMIFADGSYAGPATKLFGQLLSARLQRLNDI